MGREMRRFGMELAAEVLDELSHGTLDVGD
jgi:hypothetical protein